MSPPIFSYLRRTRAVQAEDPPRTCSLRKFTPENAKGGGA